MQIKGFDILLTYKCPARCEHCAYNAGPERKGFMKLKDAEKYLKVLTKTQPIESFAIHGGEPFLYFDILKQILEKAKKLGITESWIITNSFWAKTEEQAENKLIDLKKAGLTCITFSVDGFHQKYIPFENAKNAISAATKLNFKRVCIDSYILGTLDADNYYNNLTRKAIENLKEFENIEINQYQMSISGRATALVKYVETNLEIPTGKCQLPFWIGGNLEAPTGIEIDYKGNVTLCTGIRIGNTKKQSLIEILEGYNCATNPILSHIYENGPKGLLKIPEAKEFNQNQKFVNECHLCYEIRKFLRPFYPQYLAPKNCYLLT
jgi:MoaA/NifB/PqqE/SkfB family radical SAM enzyme